VTQRRQQKALRSGNWKYLVEEQGEHLFDLAADPGERHDLKSKYPERLSQLRRKYRQWESQMLKPIPLDEPSTEVPKR
jgi:arylsulfatase A-like enzyme